ncbi:hypothetical protein ABH925_003099 [Streptacidiphilus sp. EB129]|jgi:hypothetical protein
MAIASATPYHRNVGYLGVVPEQRGRGLIDEILAAGSNGQDPAVRVEGHRVRPGPRRGDSSPNRPISVRQP